MVLNLESTNVTFGGSKTASVTTTLGADGTGTLTITPDAGSVQLDDSINVTGAGSVDFDLVFKRPTATATVPAADAYVSAVKGSVEVSVAVVDQFGLPITGVLVDAQRTAGPNTDAAPQARKAVDSNGVATFTFTDAKAVAGQSDTVTFKVYDDQYDNSGSLTSTTTIRYTNDGLGRDYTTRLDGVTASGAGYDPASVSANPLTDTVVSAAPADEAVALTVANAEPGTPITVSVNNDALILEPGETRLSQGSASIEDVVTAGGGLPAGYQIVGTKAGVVTVTVASSGRSETSQFTVKTLADNTATARNIAVSGPAEATSGELVEFTAIVTDAFGNPVANFLAQNLNVQVGGPARLQDGGTKTDASGAITFNVRLDSDADSPVTVRVAGSTGQFGAAANQIKLGDPANNGAGLAASTDVATATIGTVVDLTGLQEAVDAAQAKVDAAEDKLADQQGDLQVAKAEKSVAQDAVKAAKKDLKKAKKQKKGVKAAKAALRAAKGDLKVAKAAVKAEQGKVNRAEADLAAAQAELEAAEQALEDAQG